MTSAVDSPTHGIRVWRVAVHPTHDCEVVVDRAIMGGADAEISLVESRLYYLKGPLERQDVETARKMLMCNAVIVRPIRRELELGGAACAGCRSNQYQTEH